MEPPRTSPIVEIVGPAGAGKSTLLRALAAGDDRFVGGIAPRTSKWRFVPVLATNTFRFLPTFLVHKQHSRWFTWSEIRSMIYLKIWRPITNSSNRDGAVVVLFDQGPLYRLVLLREFGPEFTRSPTYMHWWNGVFQEWADFLGVVIRLDAPDDVLLERIRARSTRHAVKGKSDADARILLSRYRASYEQIVTAWADRRRGTVLRYDTSRQSLDEIVSEVVSALRPLMPCRATERASASHVF